MKLKRILSILFVFLLLSGAIALDSGISGVSNFWNAPSLIIILALLFPMLVFSDNLSDFIRAFDIALTSHEYTTKELECSVNAMSLAVKLTTLSGIIGFMTGAIGMLGNISDPSAIGPGAAVALLTVYYSAIINLFFYAIRSKVQKELTYRPR